MSASRLEKIIQFFRSYGIKIDEKLIEEWLEATSNTRAFESPVCEDDLYEFNEWCRWKGTAYEEGIDDQTKIARLLDEIKDLRNEISTLKKEKGTLEDKLGIAPF
ncbi:hypothetical protein AJ85_05490 [Alkalihalobacillus alcalophilus ATCC 27647 = CGMCC 1.3604]|uniref:Uncharacterized protein n=1 Tax=Alkalihalobacillus alcalophilus ATCC 27647 = CGMCC 1.3604 TaxID=1218173 RepID=A0A094X9N6_ALKAL|nr:hypothetical protein [Alkalihalobacillus alcalophilus]KGA95485.1 hypothetical protein BALCAV_0222300 [Alkalihalobacillus alcalophilus ATCC 27647 = CGMCC 1.3604]MED1562085.1 hypothetical protein [Alkalihalobacillus alcalophilus]THG91353.1 hypothetical protein AJ85_05490 [Alkalihalobacillus alcalophilus ATCC 27647 = CGMCC 1.3604]